MTSISPRTDRSTIPGRQVGAFRRTLATNLMIRTPLLRTSSVISRPELLCLTRNVVTPGLPPNQCCDVAWALGLGGIDVDAGDTEVVTFTVGTTAPTGFYLEQINQTTGEKIYLSESVLCNGPDCSGGGGAPPPVPEPRQEALLLVVLSTIFIAMRKKKQQAL